MYGGWPSWIWQINSLPRNLRDRWATGTHNKGLQPRPRGRSFQVQMRHWHQRLSFAGRRARDRKLGSKWRPRLLHGASSRKRRLATYRAAGVLRWLLCFIWLPGSNRTLLTLERYATTSECNLEVRHEHLCRVLCRWDIHKRTNQIYQLLSYISQHNDPNVSTTSKCPH